MTNDARMDIRIPSDLKGQLGAEADRQDRSKAYIIIAALREYLGKSKAKAAKLNPPLEGQKP